MQTTRSLLAEDVTFVGPMGHTKGADDYVSGVARMADLITGIALKKVVADGDDVCIMYELSTPGGALSTVGWYHFAKNEKIDSVRAYFDPRPLTEQPEAASVAADDRTPPHGVNMPFFAAGLQVCGEFA
jgi:hypothetical protein